jgi:hypothetical protein
MQSLYQEGHSMSWEEYEKAERAIKRGHNAAVRRINETHQSDRDAVYKESNRRLSEIDARWTAERDELLKQRDAAIRELHNMYIISPTTEEVHND